jgi:hypothetical protein
MPASFPPVGAKNQSRLPPLPHGGGIFAVILPRAAEKSCFARHTPEELLVHLPAYPISTGSSGVSSIIDARGSASVSSFRTLFHPPGPSMNSELCSRMVVASPDGATRMNRAGSIVSWSTTGALGSRWRSDLSTALLEVS